LAAKPQTARQTRFKCGSACGTASQAVELCDVICASVGYDAMSRRERSHEGDRVNE
jgi:hypothetical protein